MKKKNQELYIILIERLQLNQLKKNHSHKSPCSVSPGALLPVMVFHVRTRPLRALPPYGQVMFASGCSILLQLFWHGKKLSQPNGGIIFLAS